VRARKRGRTARFGREGLISADLVVLCDGRLTGLAVLQEHAVVVQDASQPR